MPVNPPELLQTRTFLKHFAEYGLVTARSTVMGVLLAGKACPKPSGSGGNEQHADLSLPQNTGKNNTNYNKFFKFVLKCLKSNENITICIKQVLTNCKHCG
jgi:hypothetical protein